MLQKKIISLFVVMIMISVPVSAILNSLTVQAEIPSEKIPMTAAVQVYGWMNCSGAGCAFSRVMFEDRQGQGADNEILTNDTGFYSIFIDVTGGDHRFNVYGINNTCYLFKTEWGFNEFGGSQRRDIDLNPAPPRDCSIRGYLTDAVSGLPIQFENVTAISEPENYMNITSTNDTGFYIMSLIPEKYYLTGVEGYEEYYPRFSVSSGQVLWLNVSLEPLTCQLRGNITDSVGTPINNAWVSVEEPWGANPYNDDFGVLTNAAGYYEFNITRGTKAVNFRAGGFLSMTRPAELFSGNVTWLNVTLIPSPPDQCTLKGNITDFSTSNPINNADVYIYNMNRTWMNSTFTDGTGYYEMQAPAWNLMVGARDWEHNENGTEVSCLAGQTIWADIILINQSEPGATVRGNVTLDGATPSWGEVRASYWNNQWGTGPDGAGEYIMNLQAGYVELSCRAQDSTIDNLNVVLMPGEVLWYDFNLYTLAFDSIILGKVTDQSAVPVEGALGFFSNGVDDFYTYTSGAISDFNGTYEVMVPRGEPLTYMIMAQGYEMVVGSADIDQEWNWHNFSLTPLPEEVAIRGYLRDLEMIPISGHEMTASMGTSWDDMDYMNGTTTNITGYYECKVPKGDLLLSLQMNNEGFYAPDMLYLDTKEGQDVWLNISLRPRPRYFTVKGHVWQKDNTPIAGVVVSATSGSLEFVAITDAGGNYTMNVPSGSFELRGRKNGYGITDRENFWFNDNGNEKLQWHNLTLPDYPADAWLEFPMTETLEDIDGDGKNDTLHFDVFVNVTNPGQYSIQGVLKSTKWDDNRDMGSVQVEARNNTNLPAGLTQVSISFHSGLIYMSQKEFNYIEFELRREDSWDRLDVRGNQTAKYRWNDFDNPDVEVTAPKHSYRTVDTDFDGLYNLLLFNTTVNVLAPGNYTFLAQLYNVPAGGSNNNDPDEIEMKIVMMEMQPGINTVEFSFSGTRIFNSGSHLGLVYVMIYNGSIEMDSSDILDFSQAYVPYNYTEFQNYPIDSLVYGWVNESDGTTPIDNATVEIYNITSRCLNETRTNSTGYYELGGWEGSWLLVADNDDETSGEYQGNLTIISLNAATPLHANRTLQESILDSNILTIIFDDWDNATVDMIMDIYVDNETIRYQMDVHEWGNGDGFISESETDMILGMLESMIQMPSNLSDYMTVDDITYDLDSGSAIVDVGLAGPVTSKEPVYIHQKGNYTVNTSIPAPSPHDLNINVSYDNTDMGSMGEGNSTETTHIIPPAGWGRTGNKTTVSCNFTGSDFITVDPGTDPDPFDSNITEWVNITISDSQPPTTGVLAGNITLSGRSTHYGVTVAVYDFGTGAEVSSAPTDTSGYYYIPGLLAGSYNVTAEKGGYLLNTTNNEAVVAGQTTWVDMTLYSYPPTISNVQFLAVVVNDSAQTIFADVIDEGTVGDVTLSYKNVTGSSFMIPMTLLGGDTYTATIPAQQHTGYVEFNITANDTVGNSAIDPIAGVYNITIIETVLPVFTNLLVDSDPTEYVDSTNISVDIADYSPIFGVWLELTYPIGGNTNTSMDGGLGNYYLESTYLELGLYTFTIWTNDSFDNVNSIDGTFTVVDITLPVISDVTIMPNPTEFGQETNISANITDSAGITGAWLEVRFFNGTVLFNNSMQVGAADSRYRNFTCPDIGQYNFTIWVRDGNSVWNSATGMFFVNDTSLPTISNVTAGPAVVELGGSVNITADAGDVAGLANVTLQVFGPDDVEMMNVTMNIGSYWYEFTPVGLGTFNYTIWVIDGNNVTNSSSSFFTVEDTTAPTFTSVSTLPAPQEVFDFINLTAYIDDLDSVTSCHFNLTRPQGRWLSNDTMTATGGGAWFANQTYDVLGDYSYSLWAIDPSGNGMISTGTITTTDSEAPVANAGIDRTIDAGETVTFNASLSTDNYDIDNYTWVFTDTGVQTLFGETVQYTFSNVGVFSVNLTVRDCAGLTSTDELIITVLPAITTGTVTGTVLDDSGNPVEGVTVYIEGYPEIEDTTDAAGRYTLANVPEGEQVVVFFKEGYERSSSTVYVIAGEITTVGEEHMASAPGLPFWLLMLLPVLLIAIVLAIVLMKRKEKGETIIDEIFFMSSAGLLIKHFTRRLKPDMDQDILSSMLVAVQDFIKDSFKGEAGGLEEMKFGRFQIILARGKFSIIAALILGDEPEKFKPQVQKCISDIEKECGDTLADWDGDIDQLTGSFKYIDKLIDGGYK